MSPRWNWDSPTSSPRYGADQTHASGSGTLAPIDQIRIIMTWTKNYLLFKVLNFSSMFFGLLDPDPLVRGTDLNPSTIKQI